MNPIVLQDRQEKSEKGGMRPAARKLRKIGTVGSPASEILAGRSIITPHSLFPPPTKKRNYFRLLASVYTGSYKTGEGSTRIASLSFFPLPVPGWILRDTMGERERDKSRGR